MANNVIGSLIVNLGLETARLKSDTDKAARHFNGFEKKAKKSMHQIGRGVSSLMTSMTALTGIAGVLSVSGLAVLTKSAIDSSDQIGKLSARLGASTEALSEYKHVAELSGVSFNTLTMGWQRMTRRVAEAAQGTGEAKNALIELNLSAKDLNNLAPEEQFEVIADALKGVENQADRVRLSMKLFDSEGVSLLQTMTEGAAGLREMRMEANDLGLTLSKEDTLGAASANDAIARLQASATGLSLALAKSLGPSIADVANWLRVEIPQAVNAAQQAMGALGQRIHSIWETFFENDQISLPLEEAKAKLELLETQLAGAAAGSGNAQIIQQNIDQQKEMVARLQATDDQLRKYRESWQKTYGVLEEGARKDFTSTAQNLPPGGAGGFGVGGADVSDQEAKQNALIQERLMTRVESVEVSLMAEEQRLFESYTRRQFIVEDAFESQLISEQRHQELLLQLEEQFEDQRTEISKKGYTDRQQFAALSSRAQTKQVVGELVAMTSGVAQQNRKMFELNKAAGIAQAIISTYEGVNRALETYPPPLSFAMAAAVAAAGFANVQAIRSTSFGGGGGAPSIAGSGGTPSDPVPQDTGTGGRGDSFGGSNITINISGVVGDASSVREAIVDAIETAQDNDEIRLAG